MQNLQDIQDKIFFETKSILETLCKINSKDELLAKQDLFTEVTDRIAFLRILEKNEESFVRIVKNQNSEMQSAVSNPIMNERLEQIESKENDLVYDNFEEEVIFTNELNDFEQEIETEQNNIDSTKEEIFTEDIDATKTVDDAVDSDQFTDDPIPFMIPQEESDYQQKTLEEMEERRRKIVEFDRNENLIQNAPDMPSDQTGTPQQQAERKFKLANIKGLKAVQHLFDNDPLEEEKEIQEPKTESGSLLKSNIKTDFMEAEKKKPEFRLDLNDKVAFTKSLFAGNEEELRETIDKLNSFSTLDGAKQYLSEIYYRKDWSKVDEYAQRLWNLVENKFM